MQSRLSIHETRNYNRFMPHIRTRECIKLEIKSMFSPSISIASEEIHEVWKRVPSRLKKET